MCELHPCKKQLTMIIVCILSGMTGAFLGVCFMAFCIAGAAEDRHIENIRKKDI